ncbi:MAG: pyridoxal phosphate-dependent aminotransferase [Deltaproteobacteria bacterium]|nr:pyridoxal phosphate-dependent aminotransferase [Deltaproteobacteria bacterium]RLB21251.1 MAG: pyridoxal phosphate-dependent aminotransferase [Deltaproteobacteria bacterium]
MKIASRAIDFRSFIVMDVLERASVLERQGQDIIHLEVGEPDFDTPQCIREAGIKAIREGKTHYTHSQGIPELRDAICRHYMEKYAVNVDPEQIIITSGTSPALLLIFSSFLEPGDTIIASNPYYPCYPNIINYVGGNCVFVYTKEGDGFQFCPEEVAQRISPQTKGILINSPSNPAGNLLSADRMKHIANLGKYIISDEIYHGLVYEGKEHTILEYTDKAFVLNGFSKLYAMTGWRLGYVIAPKDFVRPMQKMQQNFFISASSVSQWAGLAALNEAEGDVERMRAIFDKRRHYIVKRLRELGFGISIDPAGAFYALANAKHLSNNSYELAFEILEKAGVGVAPGIDFGSNAEGYLRFSYANSLENISEGLLRIEQFLKNR